jgi:hypothetical protein
LLQRLEVGPDADLVAAVDSVDGAGYFGRLRDGHCRIKPGRERHLPVIMLTFRAVRVGHGVPGLHVAVRHFPGGHHHPGGR